MDQIKIGKFIAKKRKEKDLTQVQLAEKLGVSDKSVSKWENAKCMPDISLFPELCDILDITINDLMSGEKVDDNEYINTLEENFINIISYLEKKKQKKKKILFITLILILLFSFLGIIFYNTYEINVKYDDKVMTCKINDKELNYSIKGQSIWNTYHTIREINNEKIYFFHSTVNIYNKRRSNWEYSQSMARLLDGKEVVFGYSHTLDISKEKIKVYYTDNSMKSIEKATNEELSKIIKNSYLMCSN